MFDGSSLYCILCVKACRIGDKYYHHKYVNPIAAKTACYSDVC